MKTVVCILIVAIFSLSSCVFVPEAKEKNSDGSPTDLIVVPQLAAPVYVAAALLDSSGRAVNKISGRVYCGDGMKQRPANRARIDVLDKAKVLTTITTDMDGSYTLQYKPGFREDFQFSISANCGQVKDTLRKDVIKNFAEVDFWIK